MDGSKISVERKKLGLSQEELAKKVGVSQKSISKYERGTRRPTYETLTAMANLFGVTIDYLLDSDKMLPPEEPRYTSEDEYELILLYRKFQEKSSTVAMEKSLEDFFSGILVASSKDEKKILRAYRQLNEDNKDIIIGKIKEILKEQSPPIPPIAAEGLRKASGK